ncbi:MAG: AarF/UbiB family protein [Myxococcales bacterium]|nr:AarF/UbiB family protein [Myxococcales bacterium]
MSDDSTRLGHALLGREATLSTSRVGRFFSSGRAALGLATTVLRGGRSVNVERLSALTSRLGELKGLGMKLGQILSYVDPNLAPEARALLSVLQTKAPASPAEAVARTLDAAFGDRAAILRAAMEPAPFAVASIGQVYRATLPEAGDVAVKVRHEGIVTAFEADFASVRGGVGLADTMLLGAAASAREAVDEVREVMLAECDFAREADHQRAFGTWLASDPTLIIPSVIDGWSTATVLTTRWEPGDSLDTFLERHPTQTERDRAGEALFRASVGGLYALGRLHADPHPGNFAFRAGRVVLYDFGCVRVFPAPITRALADLVAALRRGDGAGLEDAARRFGFNARTKEQRELLERFTRTFFQPMLVRGPSVMPPDGPVDLQRLVADKLALAKLGLPRHAMFLLRLRFGLYAVLARLGSKLDWGELEMRYSSSSLSSST